MQYNLVKDGNMYKRKYLLPASVLKSSRSNKTMATADHVMTNATTSNQAIGELKVKMTSSKNVLWLDREGGTVSPLVVWVLIGDQSWKEEEQEQRAEFGDVVDGFSAGWNANSCQHC